MSSNSLGLISIWTLTSFNAKLTPKFITSSESLNLHIPLFRFLILHFHVHIKTMLQVQHLFQLYNDELSSEIHQSQSRWLPLVCFPSQQSTNGNNKNTCPQPNHNVESKKCSVYFENQISKLLRELSFTMIMGDLGKEIFNMLMALNGHSNRECQAWNSCWTQAPIAMYYKSSRVDL